jgi:lantibiotic modifying enzyme
LYAKALWWSVQPESLTSGVRHSLVFEPLAIPFCVDGGTPDRWGIYKEEAAQLENLDVPRFERDTSGRSLYCTSTNVEIQNFFSETGIEWASQRARFTPADQRRDVAIIKGALAACIEPQGVESTSCSTAVFADGHVAELRNACYRIVEHILQTAVFTKKGSVNWVCKQKVPQSERFSYKPLGESFYNGRLGVACFLAAANRTMQDTRVQEVMSGVLREVTEIAHNRSWAKATANTLGGGITGAGGLLYALLCISQLTNDSKHIESAANLASEIASSGVYRRWGMDFFDGKAGLLFSLARLQAASPDFRFEAAMTSCGSLMLKELSSDGVSRKTTGRGSSIPNGLAHGTAGIGLALVEAFSSTREEEFADQGKTLLRAAFSEPIDSDMAMSQSVCRGTAGLSIAYTLASRIVTLPEVHGLELPTSLFVSPDMTLCCGRAGQWLARKSVPGQPRLFDISVPTLPGLDAWVDGYVDNDISLFRGVSGIGWALLERSGDSDLPGLFEFGTGASSDLRGSATNQERK